MARQESIMGTLFTVGFMGILGMIALVDVIAFRGK